MQLRMAAAVAGLICLVLITLYWPVDLQRAPEAFEPETEVAAQRELFLAPPPDEFPGGNATAHRTGRFVQPAAGSTIRPGVAVPGMVPHFPQAGSAIRPGVAAVRPPALPVLPEAGSVVRGLRMVVPRRQVAAPEAGSAVARGRGVAIPGFPASLPALPRSTPVLERRIAFTPDGTQVAIGHSQGVIEILDLATKVRRRQITRADRSLIDLGYAPDGTLVTLGITDHIQLFDGISGQVVHAFKPGNSPLRCFVLTPDAESLIGGCDDGNVIQLSLVTGAVQSLGRHGAGISAVAISPSGRLVASGGVDRTVRVWNRETPGPAVVLPGAASSLRKLAFSPDGSRLAGAGTETRVSVWQVSSPSEPMRVTRVPSVQLHTGLVFERDGAHVVVSGSRTFLLRIRLDNGAQTFIDPDEPHGSVRDLTLSPDGQTLAAVTTDGRVLTYRFDPATAAWSRHATLPSETARPEPEGIASPVQAPPGSTL